jgi:hypothetical protein
MSQTAPSSTATAPGYFAALPPLPSPYHTFDDDACHAAPDDWALAVTDIVGSTQAIAAGRHKTVNFVAAMAIGAAKNLCAPEPIPFLFGGDGAVLMVPPQHIEAMRQALARVRGAARRDHGLALRAGLATVAEVRRCGCDVRVARYEPTPGNHFGIFAGGGVGVLEDAVRGRAWPDLAACAALPEALDDGAPVDLTGLSCRWAPLQSRRGKMLTLIVHGAPRPREVYAAVMQLAGADGDPRPARLDNLHARWPPKALLLEAYARRRGGWLPGSVLRVLAGSLVASLLFAGGRQVGSFDPARYKAEISTNTDFCKHDRTLCVVLDCALDRVGPIRRLVAERAATEGFEWGMDLSDTALMTCLVTSASAGLHVHFVDGGGGGYTNAASRMKAARATAMAKGAKPPATGPVSRAGGGAMAGTGAAPRLAGL